MVQDLQELLDDIFADEKRYDSQLLCFLGVPGAAIEEYEGFLDRGVERGVEMDQVVGASVPEDGNASFVSIVGYKALWVGDHY